MKLLMVSGFWPTTANPISGIFVVQQIAALARLGCHVTVALAKTLGRPAAPYLAVEQLGLPAGQVRLVEFPVVRLPEKLSDLPGVLPLNVLVARFMYGSAIARLAADGGPFDGGIVHGGRYAGLTIPAWRHHVRGGVALVVHGIDPVLAKAGNAERTRGFFTATAHAADAVVLVGNPLVGHAGAIGIPEAKLQVVPNGTELPGCDMARDARRDPSTPRHIVSVSNLIAWKGIDLNLRALADLATRRPELSWVYRVVGDGPERARLADLAEALGIAGQVSFLGRIPYAQTMREVADADIFALPSWAEAFGIVYLEAMARSRPVIGCHENGAADIITSGRDGLLIPPRDVAALAEALEKLIENPDLCRDLGREGRKTAEQYSWEHNARRMLALLGMEPGPSNTNVQGCAG
jgi:glycosyltransferase involved in cell wall biosynthesis